MSTLPPTPAPSTDIAGKSSTAAKLDTIALPPAAIAIASDTRSRSSSLADSDSSYHPLSPVEPDFRISTLKTTAHAKKRQSVSLLDRHVAAHPTRDYALPPPPTRSRKIIQIKPHTSKALQASVKPSAPPTAATTPSTAGAKKKQGAASTAAGRKIARKTAHSLIERRRRSKMNEVFGVLKDMIPACTGQDMHKLAILQANIDYMRYLETCVAELKSAHKNCKPGSRGPVQLMPQPSDSTCHLTSNDDSDGDGEDSDDQDMLDTPMTAPAQTHAAVDHRYTNSGLQSRPSISPAMLPSATTSPLFTLPRSAAQQSFSVFPSPAVLAQQQQQQKQQSHLRLPSLSLTSPEIAAQRWSLIESVQLAPINCPAVERAEETRDDEATASALLMLNTDRRWIGGRGMSVRDLLSTQ